MYVAYVMAPAETDRYNCNHVLSSESSDLKLFDVHSLKQFVTTVAVVTVSWSYECCILHCWLGHRDPSFLSAVVCTEHCSTCPVAFMFHACQKRPMHECLDGYLVPLSLSSASLVGILARELT